MRFFLCLTLSFAIILTAVPCVSLFLKDEIITANEATLQSGTSAASESTSEETPTGAVQEANATAKSAQKSRESVKVLLHQSGKTVQVSRSFYILSVLAKEIDINAPNEALKAQAVCIATFLERTKQTLQDKPYDISDNPALHQSFLTKKALKAFWGDAYAANYRKLSAIVKSVAGIILTYEGQPALAAYHSSNAGRTESAENYWGKAYDYLTPVASIGDKLCPDYRSTVRFRPKTLQKRIQTLTEKNFSFPASPSDWIGTAALTPSGTVRAITIAGVELSGREVRTALGLKSSFFEVQYQNGAFVFTVSGYGHGVGLSQEGAKYMAKSGFSYRDILLHYYKGVEISVINKL